MRPINTDEYDPFIDDPKMVGKTRDSVFKVLLWVIPVFQTEIKLYNKHHSDEDLKRGYRGKENLIQAAFKALTAYKTT